jgi:hypothetical protein
MKFSGLAMIAAVAISATSALAADSAAKLETRIDNSFSPIAINTPLSAVRAKLTEEKVIGCDKFDDCDWIDATHVRHYFFGIRPGAGKLVIKRITVSEFGAGAIPALGIGVARKRKDVLKAVSKFAPELKLDCFTPVIKAVAAVPRCEGHLSPGLVAVEFDPAGLLVGVRFEGYEGA